MATKSLHEQALTDVEELRKVAFENAKNVLIEAIVPDIKRMVEGALDENPVLEVGVDDQDGKEDKLMKLPPEIEALMQAGVMPALAQLAPQMGEAGVYEVDDEADALPAELDLPKVKGDKDEEQDEAGEEDKEMDELALAAEAKDVEEKEMDEVVNLTTEDLRKAFKEVLQSELSEASVTKSFGAPQSADEGGLLDKKSGETQFKDAEAPAAKDWTVKEAKAYVAKVYKANQTLKTENAELRKAYLLLKQNLSEVHLFNHRLLHAQKLIRKNGLSGTKANAVIEAFDRATSVREVELVYKSLSESLTKIAGVVTEARDIKGAKASRTVKPSATVLNEGAEREGGEQYSRWATLAGLKDAVK